MLELASLNVLDKTPAFTKSLDPQRVKNMYFDYDLKYHTLAIALLKRFRKLAGTEALQQALTESLETSKKRSLIQKLVKTGATLDQKYFNRRVYRYLFTYEKQDRRLLFKVCAQLGMIK
jgi:lysyl-tRNA synthetase class II